MKPVQLWFPIGLCLLFVALALGVTLSGASGWAVASMWGLAVAGGLVVAVYVWQASKVPVRFVLSNPTIAVVWYDERYAVLQMDVVREVERVVSAFAPLYGRDATVQALNGCQVYFREPSWEYGGRSVAGLQFDAQLEVGWASPLSQSALAHELGQRVLQVLGGDPLESEAHALFAKLGL